MMVITFVIMALSIAAMAVGYVVNNKPISGTCGGLANYNRLSSQASTSATSASSAPTTCASCGKEFTSANEHCLVEGLVEDLVEETSETDT